MRDCWRRSRDQAGRFGEPDGALRDRFLATDDNIAALTDLSGSGSTGLTTAARQSRWFSTWIRAHSLKRPLRLHLLPTLFLFNQFGDLERCRLRPANVHSAHYWRDALVPVVERHKEREVRLYFRGDAAFASPALYEYLEAEGMLYVIRLPANKVLQESIAHLLTRPVGRPPNHVRR